LNIPWYIPYNKVGPPDFTKSGGPMEYSNYTREGEREREGRGRERERERERERFGCFSTNLFYCRPVKNLWLEEDAGILVSYA
jgi:hypothetical protein